MCKRRNFEKHKIRQKGTFNMCGGDASFVAKKLTGGGGRQAGGSSKECPLGIMPKHGICFGV